MSIVSIVLPKLGESVAEATILKWLKAPGDSVAIDESIAEVATDKVDTDLPSEYEGVIHELLVKEGETVAVGSVIATIEIVSEVRDTPQKDKNEKVEVAIKIEPKQDLLDATNAPAKQEYDRKTIGSAGMFLTPVVRNIAIEAGLTPDDLLRIRPTGSHQTRITKKDILNFLAPKPEVTERDPKRKLNIQKGDEVIPLTRIRKLIAEHMSTSVHTAAHVTSWVLTDVTDAVEWRESHREDFMDLYKVRLTYTHIFLYQVARTLLEFPKLNAWLNGGEELIIKKAINLGVATATPDDNLIVPNLKQAQSMDLKDISIAVSALGQAAKRNRLKPQDIEDTTFTVSNTGIFGSLMGTPILALPQVGILALGAIESVPSVVERGGKEVIQIRKKMYMSMSYDHRIIDGAYGSRFLSALRKRIETNVLE